MKVTVDGGILAGGLSTRMDGKDKGLQRYENQVMTEAIAAVLRPYVSRLLISCNRNESSYAAMGDEVCRDVIDGYKGPLAGVHSLLSHSHAEYLLVSPCDTPKLSPVFCEKMLSYLQAAVERGEDSLLCAVRTKEKDHPLHLLVHRSYQEQLESSLNKNEFKVMKWLSDNGAHWLDFENEREMFTNLNTLDSLQD